MYRLPVFIEAALKRGYGVGGVFKGLTRMFALVVKKGLLDLGKQVLQRSVQVVNDISWRENVKMALKRRVVEGVKKMGKKASTATKKKISSVDLLRMSIKNKKEWSFSELELFKWCSKGETRKNISHH